MFMKRRRGVSGGFLRSEDDPYGSQEPRHDTHTKRARNFALQFPLRRQIIRLR
jgi:hypothetical protein